MATGLFLFIYNENNVESELRVGLSTKLKLINSHFFIQSKSQIDKKSNKSIYCGETIKIFTRSKHLL